MVTAFTADVVVPQYPDYDSRVVLQCNYQLNSGERVRRMVWLKDGEEFMTYSQEPEEYRFFNIRGIDINVSHSGRAVDQGSKDV